MTNQFLNEDQHKKIANIISKLFHKYPPSFNQWENIEKIAKENQITLKENEMQDISGMLYKNDNQWTIIVNQNDSTTRKLFTIAHELGHYFLHKDEQNEFIDSQFVQPNFKRSETAKFTQQELEANEFAGNLIMPSPLIKEEIGEPGSKKIHEKEIKKLAAKFHVSPIAMLTRLRNLNYICSDRT